MRVKSLVDTETKQFFEIKNDLATAIRDGIPSIIEFHLNELVAMQMHTDSERLRRACAKTIAEHRTTKVAAQA